MRILASLIIGFLFFFYFSALLSKIKDKFPAVAKFVPINHSVPGLIFILVGIAGTFLFADPIQSLASFFLIGSGLGMLIHHLLFRRYFLFEHLEQNFAQKHENLFERFLEMLPGILLWIALTSPIWLSFTLPFALAYLIILADVYWLFNAFKIGILILMGYKKMEWAKKQDWIKLLEKDFPQEWDQYYHLLVIPTYKESLEVLTPAFDAITKSTYPKERIFLVVGLEERDDPQKIKETQEYLKNNIGPKIGGAFATIHPFGLEGEVPGPGSNRNWMINNLLPELKKRGIKPEQVIATTLDADFVIHPQFLTGALHKYLSTPEEQRDKSSFTGVFLYHNNYWQTPSPMRLMANGTSLWQLAEMVGSDKYINYSSMSMNLKSLLDVGLWMPDKVNDDWGFYCKAYYYFKGRYKVFPHFLPLSADAVQDETLLKTLQNQYLQIKRWSYGVEHIPYFVKHYFKENVDFWDKTDKLFFVFWGYLKWGFMAIFITFGGLLIPVINPGFKESAVSINLPIISSWMLTGAFIGLFATIYVHEKTVPKRPKNWSLLTRFWSYIQWVLMPLILVTISSLPAIDAQTTLMLGKHLEFRVTNKARVTK